MSRILVVEDNRLELKLILHLLNNNFPVGIKIDQAATGSEAIDLLAKFSYNLVITDLIMPDKIEGIQLIRNITEKHPSTRIIAMSGSKPYYLYLAKKLGVEAVFTKPLNNEKFIEKVRELFNHVTLKN